MDRIDLEERAGVEEVDRGVCEDTFANRRLLREAGLSWVQVREDEDGTPSGLLEAREPRDPETRGSAQARAYEKHRDLLVDERDAWSDYQDCRALPIDSSAPHWVSRRAQAWEAWDATPRLPGSKGGREPYLPVRCPVVKADGNRCWAWAVDRANEGRCRAHAPGAALAANMGHQVALAKVKVMQAMPAMVDQLEGLALGAESEQVRLKATTEMMDRGGVNASTDVNVQGGVTVELDAASQLRTRLADLAERLAPKALPEGGGPPASESIVAGEVLPGEEAS